MKAHKAKMQGNEGTEGYQNDLRQGTGASLALGPSTNDLR